MSRTTVTWNVDKFQAALVPAINKGLTAAALVCAEQARELLSGPSPSAPGSPPGVDTGHLRNSISHVSPEAAGTPLKAHFGTAVFYGRHLEFGAYIKPKQAKYLAIPVDRGLAQKLQRGANKAHGTSGFSYGVRNIPGLKYIPPGKGSKPGYGGKLVMARSSKVHVRGQKNGRKVSAGATAFILKDFVIIRKRPWIMQSALMAAPKARAAAVAVTKAELIKAGMVSP